MSKQLLIERFELKEMKYIAESPEKGSRYLGRFEGIAADFLHPTRNGRRYPLELWENVANSDDFKEAMETKTLYGEADHPETRLETLITEAAICLRSFEIRKDEGVVWCSFDILDTPRGRILKSLLDYGSKIGVSSRGSGDEIVRDGETIIDPDTYLFICFDAVIMPAVKSARQSVTESVDLAKAKDLTESVKSEIAKAKTPAELNSIKTIIEAIEMPDLDSLKESIDIQLEKLGSGEDISTSLMTDLEESVKKNEALIEENKKLKSRNIAGNTRISEMRKIISKMNKDSEKFRRLLNDAKSNKTSLENDLLESASQCEEFESEIKMLKQENSVLRKKIGSTSNSVIQLRKEVNSLSTNKEKLTESIEKTRTESKQLSEAVKSNAVLKRRLALTENNYKSKLKSEKKLTEQVEGLGRKLEQSKIEIKKITEGYLSLVSRTSGFSKSSIIKQLPKSYGIKDIDMVVEDMRSQRDRINKMPIAMESVGIAFSKSTPDSQEIAQTKSILRSMKS